MKAKINNFYNLLNEFRYVFYQILMSKSESYDEGISLIKSIYSCNENQFPFDIRTAFEELYTENPDKMELIFWDKLKESYYNYEQFIELDYQYFQNSDLPKNFQDLFYYSKILSYNYFTYVSRIYYWYYGRKNENRNVQEKITVDFLNDYGSEISDLYDGNTLQKIQHYFSFNFEMLENYVKYIYAKNNFHLEVVQLQKSDNSSINKELERLANDYYSKLEILTNYKDNITKLAMNLRFDFPDFLHNKNIPTTKVAKSQESIKFVYPENVFNSLLPHIEDKFSEQLKKLIFGELSNVDKEITFRGGSSKFVYFFKQLYESNHLIADSKERISDWIVKNFLFYDEENFKNFKKDTIQKTLMRDSKAPRTKIEYLI